jgi:putative hydrolase of the HAD superfamily
MKAVVFDFGGVVFRWQPLTLLQEVLPAHARDEASARDVAAQIFQSFVPHSDWAEFDRGAIEARELAQRIAARPSFSAQEVGSVIDAIPPHLEPVNGTVALMRRLKDAGHPIFYLSNMPAPYADHLERSNEFFSWFDGGVFSARVGLIKPDPAVFDLMHSRFGITPGRSVFIDDHAGNIQSAQACGWQAVHFQSAAQCEAQLAENGWL